MKKRILAILLAATATLSATFGLTACNEGNSQPKWGNEYSFRAAYAQAQELGYAGTLEEFIDMISGKDGKNGADGKDGVGVKQALIDESGHLIILLTNDKEIDCGEVRNIHEHEYGEWATLIEADCIKIGLQMRVCETCGYPEAKFVAKTEHDWSNWYSYTDEEHLRHCGTCKETENAPHDFDEDGFCADCGKYKLILPLEGEIIENFGFTETMEHYQMHQAIDIGADEGAEVVAAMGGTIESIVYNHNLDGTNITIEHPNGLKVKYKFIDVNPELKVGDKVKQGEVIGTVSAACGSEFKLGSHLHLETIKNGLPQNPIDYFFEVFLTE